MNTNKPRSSKLVTEQRIFTVQSWIIQGVPDTLILKQAKDQWGIGLRQAKNYLAKAYSDWRESAAASIEEERQAEIGKLQQQKRLMSPEFRNTPAGLRVMLQYDIQIQKLKGVIPPKQHVVKGDEDQPIVIKNSIEAIDHRLAELLKKAQDDPRFVNLLKD